MNILRTLFRRLGSSPHPLRGAAEACAENRSPAKNYWLLVHAAMPRY